MKVKEYFQERIHSQIPITKHMGIKVERVDDAEVVLSAPLPPNHNHKCTVFGGSLASATLLCGWCAVVSKLKEWSYDGHVVVASTQIDYLLPVRDDFRAVCKLPPRDAWEEFREKLVSKGKASIVLDSYVYVDGKAAVKLKGTYVATFLSGNGR